MCYSESFWRHHNVSVVSLRSSTLKGVAFATLCPSGFYAEVVAPARATINIREGIFPWWGECLEKVLLWRRHLQHESSKKKKKKCWACAQLLAAICSPANWCKIATVEKSPGGTWSPVQFFLQEGASKMNQITITVQYQKKWQHKEVLV